MNKKFVRITSKIDCDWEGLSPIYRLYLNDELFAERTWIWDDRGVEENLQIEAEPGEYRLRYELVPPHLATLKTQKIRVDVGPAAVVDNLTFRIL